MNTLLETPKYATVDEAFSAGVTSERTRWATVLALPEVRGRESLARQLLAELGAGPEVIARILSASPIQNANPLAAAMARVPNPSVGSDADSPLGLDEAAHVRRILELGGDLKSK